MDFMNNLASKSQNMAKKAKDTAEIFKWNTKIGVEKDKIKKAYEDIGRLFCALNPESPSEEYFDYYAKIDESKQMIEQYEDEISKIKNSGICRNCGAQLEKGALYCSVCGKRQENPGEDKEKEQVICPHCGEKVEDTCIRCPKCGKNIHE